MNRPGTPGQVRIISGALRGRKLTVPRAQGLRPTPDRTRETLFNWLGPLHGLQVLDLFAGSGALGIEAASRGAAGVVMVERDRDVARTLAERVRDWQLGELVTVSATDARDWLDRQDASRPFDLVFLDPPFAGELLQPCLDRLAAGALLARDARVYVEYAHDAPPEAPAGWQLHREGRSAQTGYRLYHT